MKHLSLLGDPVLRVATEEGKARALTLPQLLAQLSGGAALSFIALRPHQRAAWHAFLVQLAFLALEAGVRTEPPQDDAAWAELLRGLTPEHPGDEPWHLVVDDWTLPAFMQSPCVAGAQGDYRNAVGSAQELDLLVTSKNHDEKIGKLRPVLPEAVDVWVYALLSLQGFAGFLGRGNFNTMRMNGGFGSRPQFRLLTQRGSGVEFLRDLGALQAGTDNLYSAAETAQIGLDRPLALLWLPPWSAAALPLRRVHPLCLEVTRRVRLRGATAGLEMLSAASATMRVAAKDAKGLVQDPWTPVIKDGEPRALTAQADSFNYHRLAPLLFDDTRYQLPLLARPTEAEIDAGGGATLLAQVLVGGSGRTDGALRREVPMPTFVLRKFATQRDVLAARARTFIDLASLAQGKVLRAALLQFVDGSEDVNWQNKDFAKAVMPWVELLERRIDDVFFAELFKTVTQPPMPDAEANSRWIATLSALARETFDLAVSALPTRDRSLQMARTRAERVFDNGLRKHLQAEPDAEGASGKKPARGGKTTKSRAAPAQEQDP
jgi:CRISPR system Cascade subunit CasA